MHIGLQSCCVCGILSLEAKNAMLIRLNVEIEQEIKQEAKAEAYREGKTLKEKVNSLILEWLKGKKGAE